MNFEICYFSSYHYKNNKMELYEAYMIVVNNNKQKALPSEYIEYIIIYSSHKIYKHIICTKRVKKISMKICIL